MKFTSKLFMFAFTLLALAAIAHAESPREQLAQMVEQLQKTPTDNTLREKIIKLAQEVKPAPAILDKAIEYEGRAQFAFKSAKSEADFISAAREYESAIAVAPWVPGYYSDLCTIYEKASRFEDAKRNCEFYLVGLTDPAQMTDVKRRIAGLTFGIEKANSPQAREDALWSKVEGARFVDDSNKHPRPRWSYESIYELSEKMLHFKIRIHYMGEGNRTILAIHGKNTPGEHSIARMPYRDGAFTYKFYDTDVFTIRPDGQALIKTTHYDEALYGAAIKSRIETIPRQ